MPIQFFFLIPSTYYSIYKAKNTRDQRSTSLSLNSKYGRPPAKKVKDRKPSTRRASNSISTPDITGIHILLALRVPVIYNIHCYRSVLSN